MPSLLVMLLLCAPALALAKPPAVAAHPADTHNVHRAKTAVDKLTVKLTGMVKRAEAPGMDVPKVQALVAEFQAHMASQRKESEELEALLTDDEKAEVGQYIAERVTPLLARFEAVYKRVQTEADPTRDEREKALGASLDALGTEAEAAVQLAKAVGNDPAKRAAAVEALEKLTVAQHALYHAGIAEVQAGPGREPWENLFAGRVERPLLHAERLLRIALQAPSEDYQQAQIRMADLTKQTETLHGEWHAVQDWPGLKALQERETALQTAVQGLVQGWRLLPADEAVELDTVARETLVPAVERMNQDSAEARKRLPPEPGK